MAASACLTLEIKYATWDLSSDFLVYRLKLNHWAIPAKLIHLLFIEYPLITKHILETRDVEMNKTLSE